MRKTDPNAAKLDRFFRPCGPCLFCGHPDARHRLWDSVMDNFRVMTSGARHAKEAAAIKEIARDFGLTTTAVRAVLRIHPYRTGRKFGSPRHRRAA